MNRICHHSTVLSAKGIPLFTLCSFYWSFVASSTSGPTRFFLHIGCQITSPLQKLFSDKKKERTIFTLLDMVIILHPAWLWLAQSLQALCHITCVSIQLPEASLCKNIVNLQDQRENNSNSVHVKIKTLFSTHLDMVTTVRHVWLALAQSL